MRLFFFLIALFAQAYVASAQLSTIEIKANKFSNLLFDGNADSSYKMLAPEVQSQMTSDQLRTLIGTIEGQLGMLQERGKVTQTQEGDYEVTYQPFQFRESLLDLKLVFNKDELISGLFFVPHKEFKLELVDTESFCEEEIEVVTDKTYRLPGIATYPKNKEKCPAIILAHGSGPNDMDETLGPNKLFKDLAHELAKNGIAVFRYEKRTRTYAGRSEMDVANLTLDEETFDDVISAVDLARKDKRVNKKKVFVLGHSLVGMCAPRIAQRSKWVNGIIIMAGNARPFEVLLQEQLHYIFNEDSLINEMEQATLDQIENQIKALEELRKKGETENALPFGLSRAYWEYLNKYNQTAVANELNKSIVVLQGKRDYQVTVEDYELWKSTLQEKENVTFHLYDNLNHMFREGEGLCYPSEYELKSALPKYVVDDIIAWVKAQN